MATPLPRPLPMLEDPEISKRAPAPAFVDVRAAPEAFGAGLGEALQRAGSALSSIATQERQLNAQFDAADAELQYGKEQNERMLQYKKDLLELPNAPGGGFSKSVDDLKRKYAGDLEKLRKIHGASLSDRIAQKNFDVRTRVQLQSALNTLGLAAVDRVNDWRKSIANGSLEEANRDAAAVDKDVSVTVANIQASALVRLKPVEEYMRSQGASEEEIAATLHKAESDMVNHALTAYGSDYGAGLALLGSKLPGTNLTVGYTGKPGSESLLDGAETANWIRKFNEHKNEKVGADLGEQLYQESRITKGFNLNRRLTELYNLKDDAGNNVYTGSEIAKARAMFTSAVSEGQRLHDIAIGNAYEAAYKLLTNKYDGEIEKAIRAKDEQFLRLWSVLGPDQGKLRMALRKEEKYDPEATRGLGALMDAASSPGWTRQFASYNDFMNKWQPTVGALNWPQALRMYETDSKRDTSQDVHYQAFKSEVDGRAHIVTGHRDAWVYGDDQDTRIRLWMERMAEQAWVAHAEARKATPGKAFDAAWYDEVLNTITKKAFELKKSKAFRNASGETVGTMEMPSSVYRVSVKERPKEEAVKPTSQAEFDALPSGTVFIDKDGTLKTKP